MGDSVDPMDVMLLANLFAMNDGFDYDHDIKGLSFKYLALI